MAYLLDATGEELLVGNQAQFNDLPEMSIYAWLNVASQAVSSRIFDKHAGTLFQGFTLWHVNPTTLEFRVEFSISTAVWQVSSVPQNTWFHVALTYNGTSTANDPVIYFDGVSQTVNEITAPQGARVIDNPRELVLGNTRDPAGSGLRPLNGRIALAGFHDAILNQGEILAAMSRGQATRARVGFWPLFNSPEDWSGNLANLTVTGATVGDHAPHGQPFGDPANPCFLPEVIPPPMAKASPELKNLFHTGESISGSGNSPPPIDPLADVVIPAEADWTDHGTILTQSPGQWDARFEGMISPCSLIKIGTTYHLYYVGADGDRGDGGPANRKLGVATATNPLGPWTKYAGNPILSHAVGIPSCDECGVFSAGCFQHNNEVICYFGGMEEGAPGTVDGDIVLADSPDGFTFTDRGDVWTNEQSSVLAGDEIFPVAAFQNAGTFYIYFTGKWELFLAEGPAKDNITSDQLILSGQNQQAGQVIRKNATEIIVPVNTNRTTWTTEMRVANITTPETLAASTETYDFGVTNHQHRVVQLDRFGTPQPLWMFCYYDPVNEDFRMKTAPLVLA